VPRGPLAQSAEQRPGRTKAPGSSPGGVHSCVTGLTWRGHWPSKPVVPVRIRGDACGPGAYEYRQAAFNRKIAGSNPVRPSISRAWESPVVGEPGCYPGRGRFDSVPRRSGPRSPAYPDSHSRGPLAQLAERPLRKREAPGSSSVGPVRRRHAHFARVTPEGRPSAAVAEWSNAPARRAGSHRSGNRRFPEQTRRTQRSEHVRTWFESDPRLCIFWAPGPLGWALGF
jgi:hypothetical protein